MRGPFLVALVLLNAALFSGVSEAAQASRVFVGHGGAAPSTLDSKAPSPSRRKNSAGIPTITPQRQEQKDLGKELVKSKEPSVAKRNSYNTPKPLVFQLPALSPTPLHSKFLDLDGERFEMADSEDPEGEDHEGFLPNVAVNKSCVMSSVSSSQGTFCRLSEDESQRITTASEDSPYIIFDLEGLYFVDHVSFTLSGGVSDSEREETARARMQVMCFDSIHGDLTRLDSSGLEPLWKKTVLMDSDMYSFHVHSPCQLLRLQRTSFGSIGVSGLKVFGRRIVNREVIECLTDHGGKVCSGHGSCLDGTCVCEWGNVGEKCEHAINIWVGSVLPLFLVATALFALLRLRGCSLARFLRPHPVSAPDSKCYTQVKGAEQETSYAREDDGANNNSTVSRSLSNAKPLLAPPSHSGIPRSVSDCVTCSKHSGVGNDDFCGCDSSKNPMSQFSKMNSIESEGKLHLLFASPLVVNVKNSQGEDFLRPIQALDIKKEYGLLVQSLGRAAASSSSNPISVGVSTATIDQLHSLLTLGDTKCLHMSMHSTPEFLAFENTSGELHTVRMATLRGVLRSTITPRTLRTLRMVVLNACNSEAAAREFVLAGVSHAVCFRTKVRDSTAAIFTRALYLALACGRTVGDSFESAKEAVYSSSDFKPEEMDAFALLPERADHSEVLWAQDSRPPSSGKDETWPAIHNMRPLPPLADDLVGRHVEQFKVLNSLTNGNGRLVVISGPKGIGRTQLATAVAHHVHLRRSDRFFKDGVFVVKKNSNSTTASAASEQATKLNDLVHLSTLVDNVCRTMGKLIAEDDAADTAALACSLTELCEPEDVPLPKLRRAIDNKVRALTEALSQKRCLLVIDDWEESEALVNQLLQPILENSPGVSVLVTCSVPYQLTCVNLHSHHLKPLSARDSAILLSRQVRRPLFINGAEASINDVADHPSVVACKGNPLLLIKTARQLANLSPETHMVVLS